MNTISPKIPDELAPRMMEETSICGEHLKVRAKGNCIHHLVKPVGLWLLLKAVSPGSSLIQNYRKQIPALCANFAISRRTFYYHIGILEKLKLVTKDKAGSLHIASWGQLGRVFQINTNKKTKIQFTYGTKQKIHWWFAALEIKSNQELQADAVWKKANKNSDVASVLLDAMITRGFDLSKLNNPEYYAGRLFMLYVEDFETGTEVHDLLIHIRADVNRSCEKIAESWCMSPQLVSYWKKQMSKEKVIDVAKLTVTSKWSNATRECHKNKFCHVIWNDKLKERIWFLCDQVTILMPWKWTEFIELKTAA